MASLPTIVCLKSASNSKYLRYRNDEAQTHGLLHFGADDVMDPYAQFQLEKSSKWDYLFHIKSRYTNKYWVRWSPKHYWITASANEPNEDLTSWNCTLFRPYVVQESGKAQNIRLVHLQLGHYLRLKSGVPPNFVSCLFAESTQEDDHNSLDVLTVFDWESIFKIPKRVAFMSDNGQYLGAVTFNGQAGLQFSFNDPKDPKVAHQVFTSPDGTVYIKSEHYGKFWRLGNDNWIVVDAEDPQGTNNAEAMFRPTPLDMESVAFINMKTTLFIKRYTTSVRESSIASIIDSIDKHARLRLVDLDK